MAFSSTTAGLAGVEGSRQTVEGFAEMLTIESVPHLAATPFGKDDTGGTQRRQMPGDAGDVDAAAIRDLGDRERSGGRGKTADHRDATGITQRPEELRLQVLGQGSLACLRSEQGFGCGRARVHHILKLAYLHKHANVKTSGSFSLARAPRWIIGGVRRPPGTALESPIDSRSNRVPQ